MKTQSFLSQASLDQQKSCLIEAVNKGRLSHCILFYGSDIQAQYELALDIAKKLNPDELSQKWIAENKHPAVLTVSKIKTNITVEQARELKNSLALSSDYHRIFIFHDEDGINQINFSEATANTLLKTFEEPPERVTFFFLTKNKDDMLGTIISRAQSFYVPRQQRKAAEEENEFDQLQREYLTKFRNEPARLVSAMRDIEDAKKQLALNMNEQNVRETLNFKLGL